MPDMTEAEYATVEAVLAEMTKAMCGLGNVMHSLTARVDAVAAAASLRRPAPAFPRARSAA
jgi:hypothetical protein